jgi:RNA polymerase sigma-70 factor (ECF subfamily)
VKAADDSAAEAVSKSMSDRTQVVAIPRVEPEAHPIMMEKLVAFQETVFLICLGFTRHPWDAQELAQEAYLQAQQRLHQLRRPEAAKAWLCRLTRNICLDHLRAQKWRRLLWLDETEEQSHNVNPEVLLEVQEQIRQVKRAIGQLPKKLRDVFILRAYGELSYEEVAQTLDIHLGTVMSRLSRARARVRNAIEKGGPR